MAYALAPHHRVKPGRHTHLRPLLCLLWSLETFLQVLTAFASLLACVVGTARRFLLVRFAQVLFWLWLQFCAVRLRYALILPPEAFYLHLAFV